MSAQWGEMPVLSSIFQLCVAYEMHQLKELFNEENEGILQILQL